MGGYLDEWFDDLPAQGHDESEATTITLTDQDREDLVFALERGRTISGTVRDRTGSPVARGLVTCFGASGHVRDAAIQPNGTYEVTGLIGDAYWVQVVCEDVGYLAEWYGGLWCDEHSAAESDPVVVDGTDVEGVDFELNKGAVITGTVSGDDGQPVPRGYVWISGDTGG